MSYVALQNITLASNQASVTFSNIPSAYRDLVVVINGNTTAAENVSMRFNGDTGSNYSFVTMYSTGSSGISGQGANTNLGAILHYNNTTSRFTAIGNIMDYSATDKHKTTISRGNQTDGFVMSYATRWANTAAITSVTCFAQGNNFASGTTLALYGIAG